MLTTLLRRRALITLAAASLLTACATPPGTLAADAQPPIVFVHGNGDTAALWTTTLWRWESNGWPRARLHAVDFPNPSARDDNTKDQPGRSSADDQMRHLAAEVDKVLAATGAVKVVLMGNSRGGNAIRHYIQNGGGAAKVSHAILGGTPNHGVWSNPGFRPNNEFNGAGQFLTALNAPKGPGGDEVTPGVQWMTIRSDNNDKFAQPDGVWIGAKGTPTNVSFDGPALKGATNMVLPGRDHREVSYHPEAFAAAFRFVTGRAPATSSALHITPEAAVTLSGKVSGFSAGGPTNLPLPGARLQVFAIDPTTGERRGTALIDQATGADGRWGPLRTDSRTALEFVLEPPASAPGLAISHTYRAPFPRASDTVHLRPERAIADADKDAAAIVTFVRPRAYFGLPRDVVLINGETAPGIPPGVAGVATAKRKMPAAGQAVTGEFRSGVVDERIAGRTWPAAERRVTVLELHE
ncbi:MAG: twin-arginine translocation pathway signal [Aquabacterium sp.]|nr:twin-arginine translocation pathway signal [Aquabacterium sp.]